MATTPMPGAPITATPWVPIAALRAFQRPYIPEPATTKGQTFTYDDDNGIMCDGFKRVDPDALEALFLVSPAANHSLNPRSNPSARWTTAQLRLYGVPFRDGASAAERLSCLEVAVQNGGSGGSGDVLAHHQHHRGQGQGQDQGQGRLLLHLLFPSPYMVAVERRLALEWERRKRLGEVDVSAIHAAQFAACAGDPAAEAALDPLRFLRKYFLDERWRPRWPGTRRPALPPPPPSSQPVAAAGGQKGGQTLSLRKAMFINRIMKTIKGSSPKDKDNNNNSSAKEKTTDQGAYNYFHDNNMVVIGQRLANEATLRAMVRLVPRLQMHVTPRTTMFCWDESFDAAFDLLPSLEDQADLDTDRFLDRHFRRGGGRGGGLEPDRAPYKTPWPITLGPSVREATRARLAEAIVAIPGLCVAFAPNVNQGGSGGDATQWQQGRPYVDDNGGGLPKHDRILVSAPTRREDMSRRWEFPGGPKEAAAEKARIDTIVGWERRAILGQARAQQAVVEQAEDERVAGRAARETAWAVSTVGHVQLELKAAARLAPPIPPPKPVATTKGGRGAGKRKNKKLSSTHAALRDAAAKLALSPASSAAAAAAATALAASGHNNSGGISGGGRSLSAIPRQIIQAPVRMLRRRPNMASMPVTAAPRPTPTKGQQPQPQPQPQQQQGGVLQTRRLRLTDLTGSYIVRCETLDPAGWFRGGQRLDVQRPAPTLHVGDLISSGRQQQQQEKPSEADLQDPFTFFSRPRPPTTSFAAPGAVAAFDFGGLQGTMVLGLTRAATAKTPHFLAALERARRIRLARARRAAERAVEARRWELIGLGEGLVVAIDDLPYDEWVREEWALKEERDAARRARRERLAAERRRAERRAAEKRKARERARARRMYGGGLFGLGSAAGKMARQQQRQLNKENKGEDRPDPEHPDRVYFQWAGRDRRRNNMIIPDVGRAHVGYLDFEPARAPAGAKVSSASAALVARGMICLPVLPGGHASKNDHGDHDDEKKDVERAGSGEKGGGGADGPGRGGDYQMVPISVHKVSAKPRRRAERWENFSWKTYWNTYGRWQGEKRGLTAWKTDGF